MVSPATLRAALPATLRAALPATLPATLRAALPARQLLCQLACQCSRVAK